MIPARDWAEELIEKAHAEGWINQLYKEFCLAHPDDFLIVVLRNELGDSALDVPIGDAGEMAGVVRRSPLESACDGAEALQEDPLSTHLVVAVFRQKGNKLRVQPWLYYRAADTGEICQKSLVEDGCTVSLETFPEFLKQLVKFTYEVVKELFPPPSPWTLTIELFVPIELLGQPLSTWCGADGALLCDRPLVMGCSDRFNPDLGGDAIDLHNKLTLGWQRFQAKVPDQVGSNLRNLAWLTSPMAATAALGEYSGFRCHGDWLKSDEAAVKNWQELVNSGIPLALWMCGGNPTPPDAEAVFEQLVDCTRFEFPKRLPLKRDRQRKTCDYYVGVLYEDPNYVPPVPLPPSGESFVWPET